MASIEITDKAELKKLHKEKVEELYRLQAELRQLRAEIKAAK